MKLFLLMYSRQSPVVFFTHVALSLTEPSLKITTQVYDAVITKDVDAQGRRTQAAMRQTGH